MSFLTRTTPVLRVGALRVGFASTRAFSTTMAMKKSPVETAKDAAKTVDRKVSDKLVDGIEIGRNEEEEEEEEEETCANILVDVETAAEKAKTAAGLASDKASGKTAEVKGEAKGKAAEIKGEAKGKAEEVKGKL
ncbi:hypothetical protein LARI1_G004081 [Lachnellula arida]|uniref:Uncharacterized protein n=1 Tax=Lachnellula arida TaxID=1316785 RepID=A0A8T9BHB5_9HELO|nr:hypothetical protein LARI1_G004081 [Lachnellula arida]